MIELNEVFGGEHMGMMEQQSENSSSDGDFVGRELEEVMECQVD